MSFVRLPYRLWMVALAGVLGAGGFGFSLAFTGSAAALEVPTITTSPAGRCRRCRSSTRRRRFRYRRRLFRADADRFSPDAAASGTHADRARAAAHGFSARGVGADVAVGSRSSYLVARSVGSPTGSVVRLGSGGTGPGGASGAGRGRW